MWMKFIERPAITIADWHSFNHFFDGRPDGKGFKDHEHLTYTHFSLFREPIRNCEAVAPVKYDTPHTDIEAIAFKGKEKAYLMIVNKYGNEHTLDKVSASATCSAGVQLLHRTDMPLEQAMQNTERCERVELSADQLSSVNLPPYSITRLEFDL
jgi:hypothetical protein